MVTSLSPMCWSKAVRSNRSFLTSLLASVVLVAACGDDGDSTTGTSSSSSSGSSASSSSGSGGMGQGGSGEGGTQEDVNPVEGVGDVVVVQSGFQFTEGTFWFADLGVMRFSDVRGSRIHEIDAAGQVTVFREGSNNANGLGVTPDGLLVTCEHSSRRVTRTAADGTITAIAETFEGKRFNSPNDIIVRTDGTIYFTDPSFGLPQGETQEIAYKGVFRIAPDGTISLVEDGFSQPNGVALSPDEATLYVADTEAGSIHRFQVNTDGSVGAGEKIADVPRPDGVAIDNNGNLYIAGQEGIYVLKADGTSWGLIPVPAKPTNCTFGDTDGKTLYISAQDTLYKVGLGIAGLP